jgi:hypothetical protein
MKTVVKIVVAVELGSVAAVYTNREDVEIQCVVVDYDMSERQPTDIVGVDDCGSPYLAFPRMVEPAAPHVVSVHDTVSRAMNQMVEG